MTNDLSIGDALVAYGVALGCLGPAALDSAAWRAAAEVMRVAPLTRWHGPASLAVVTIGPWHRELVGQCRNEALRVDCVARVARANAR